MDGSREPLISFFNGLDELPVIDENITLQSSDTDGTKWKAELLIDELSLPPNEEGTLGFKVTVLDKAGNRRVIEFSDDGTFGDGFVSGLIQKVLRER